MGNITPQKHLERISWRFRQGKAFTPNERDINALNGLISYVAKKERKQINDHVLFAKLYIYVYGQFLRYYQGSVFDPIPQQELHRVLAKDIRVIIQEFTDQLNEIDQFNLVGNGHPAKNSREEKAQFAENVLNYTEQWDYDTVKQNIAAQINAVINQYG